MADQDGSNPSALEPASLDHNATGDHDDATPTVPEDNVDDNNSGNKKDESADEENLGSDRDEDSEDDEPVESLVQGRDRRSNQANRYASLLEQETAADDDDELALLFAEADDEDLEFEDPDAADASDAAEQDDSSTDDEDQGPTAGQDDLEGEAQLKKEERAAKRAEKRKAEKAFVKAPTIRKKVKIDESASPRDAQADPDRPALVDRKRKMSERLSWLPTGAPARTSSRTLSVQNKARTMASMKASESRRMRQIAVMEAAQKRKDAAKAKPLTQADRLAEAAETERINSRSLNKWEEMEREREKKQKARLDALQNRKIEGPLFTWYSAKAEWVDGKLKRIGKHIVTEVAQDKLTKDGEPKKRTWKKKARLLEADASKEATPTTGAASADAQTPGLASQEPPESDIKASEDTSLQGALDPPTANSSAGPVDTNNSEGHAEGTALESTIDIATAEPSENLVEETPSEKPSTIYDQPNLFEPPTEQTQDMEISQDRDLDTSEIKDQNQLENQLSETKDTNEADEASEILPDGPESQRLAEDDDQDASHKISESQDPEQSQDTSNTQEVKVQNANEENSSEETQPAASEAAPEKEADSSSNQTAPEPKLVTEIDSEEQLDSATSQQQVSELTPSGPGVTEYSARNLLTVKNFDTTSIQDASVLRHVVFGTPLPANFTPAPPATRINARVPSQIPPKPVQPVCAITGYPAKYRDPSTGLPYSSVDAYRAIRKLVDGGCVWSNLLGAWCGGDGKMLSTGGAARGVPDGFYTGVKPQEAQGSTAAEGSVKVEAT